MSNQVPEQMGDTSLLGEVGKYLLEALDDPHQTMQRVWDILQGQRKEMDVIRKREQREVKNGDSVE